MRMMHLFIGLLLTAITLPTLAQDAPAPTNPPGQQTKKTIVLPPMPEFYQGKKEGMQLYLKAALDYVQKNPQSPFIPRVFLDMYMTAIYTGNVKLAEQTRTNLLWNTPTQLYGSFILSTFKTPQQLHDFIVPYVSSDLIDINKAYCNQLYLLIASAIRMQGWDFLKNPPMMLKCALLIDRLAPDDLKAAYMDQMNGFLKSTSTESKIAEICFKRNLSTMDKVSVLQNEFPNDPTARFARMVYMADLTPQQLASSRMLEIRCRQLISQGRYDLAEPKLKELIAADNQSQYRFWLGWCQASQGHTDAARATLAHVPSDPWRGAAQRLERQLASLADNLSQQGQIIQAMVQNMAQNIDGLEMTVKGTLPDNKPFDLYVGIGADQNVYLQLKENGRVEVSYHSDKNMCEVYLEKYARKFKKQGVVPIPIFDIVKTPETGRFEFQFAISIKPYAELEPALKKCLSSKYLTTTDGLSDLMVGMIKKGAFPAAATQNVQGIGLKWLSPTPDTPEFNERLFTVDTIGKLLSVTGSNLSVTWIKYAPRDQMILSAPAMPRANYVEANEADGSFRVNAYNRILKTLMAAMK